MNAAVWLNYSNAGAGLTVKAGARFATILVDALNTADTISPTTISTEIDAT